MATKSDQYLRVRDVDPELVLVSTPLDGRLEPYLPRDVDDELDRALAKPGVVLIEVEPGGAGARRAAFEALKRNLPDALLIVGPDPRDLPPVLMQRDTVIWLDGVDFLRPFERFPAEAWLIGFFLSKEKPPAWMLTHGRLIRVSIQLSEHEKDTAHRLYPALTAVETVPDFVDQVTRRGLSPLIFERHSAGYRADTDEGQDRLGVSTDVNMLADLVASRLIKPPLSIGLFGNWGSGKSFFMRQMEKRIDLLATEALAAEADGPRDPAVSSYCSSVRQIRFNAWHYVEANLWASLATHIFDNLASTGPSNELQRFADELAEQRKEADSLLEQLSAVRLERMMLSAQQEKVARTATRKLARQLKSGDLSFVAPELKLDTATTEEIQQTVDELSESKIVWTQLRKDPVAITVAVLGVLLAGVLFFVVRSPVWPALVAGLAVLGSVLPVVARARAGLTWLREAVQTPDSRLAELDEELEQLERAVAELAPGHDVTAFAQSRGGSQDYRQHLGVVSLVRKDLEMFAAILASGAAGPERIVLYIDDLDRCPPPVVIKVLEAVHLLLALPVFVVVVGVDARWLSRAIKQHYDTMLDDPVNYLEKIFQIPFTLSAMDDDGFRQLVNDLAEADAAATAPVEAENNIVAESVVSAPRRPEGRSARTSAMDMTPRQLVISASELDFLARLGPLVPSPRAAKRLTNLYRLLRARLSGPELDEFVGGDTREAPYRAVLVLLAVLAGRSDTAPELFRALAGSADNWRELLATVAGDRLDQLPQALDSYQRWLPLVRRFSFV